MVSGPFCLRDSADCICEKSYALKSRVVILVMETCSLACSDIKETSLSRKNNMHRARARGIFYVHVSYIRIF